MTLINRIAAVLAIAMALSGCGAVHNSVVTPPTSELVGFKRLTLVPVEVSSTETNEDATALNDKWRKMAAEKLTASLDKRGIALGGESQGVVECKIDVRYGSRALRYFVGFGAGKGSIRVVISLRDPNGGQRYSVQAKADLAVGAFGGSMSSVASDTIDSAVADFVSRL